MWMSCTPLAGVKPNTSSVTPASGPQRWPKAKTVAAGSAIARPQPVVEQVGEVVVGAGERRRQQAHPRAVEEVAADVVQVRSVGAGRERVPAGARAARAAP